MKLWINSLFISVLLTCVAAAAHAADFGPLADKVYGSGNRALVVFLHGDVSSGGAANYHFPYAKTIAAQNKGTVAVALIRPGYSGGSGLKSPGSNNNRRDHYTKRNNDLVAQTIKSLVAKYKPKRVILAGHSGGSAQIGAIIGRYPGIAHAAVLVSCPCDTRKWRAMRGKSAWTASQSPIKYVTKVSRKTRIIAITGASDSNTRPVLAQEYVAAAASGHSAQVILVKGASHSFRGNLAKQTISNISSEIRR